MNALDIALSKKNQLKDFDVLQPFGYKLPCMTIQKFAFQFSFLEHLNIAALAIPTKRAQEALITTQQPQCNWFW